MHVHSRSIRPTSLRNPVVILDELSIKQLFANHIVAIIQPEELQCGYTVLKDLKLSKRM